ncbi:MAG: hypothetical protein LBC44_01265 [Mycoplasmataceae bacterium]|nr:hypothetical protein [Mycoplasmataceae bacterium]
MHHDRHLSLSKTYKFSIITKLDISNVLENTLSTNEFITLPIEKTILSRLVFSDTYTEEGQQKAFKEELEVANINETKCRVQVKEGAVLFNPGYIDYSYTITTSASKLDINTAIPDSILNAQPLAINFWGEDLEEAKQQVINAYAEAYGLPSKNQLRVTAINYDSDNVIKERIATVTIAPVSYANTYKGTKNGSFKFKPTLEKVIPNRTNIPVTAALYDDNLSADAIAFSLQTNNTNTCSASSEIENGTQITYNSSSKSFTVVAKPDGPFLNVEQVEGTVFNGYKRVTWDCLNVEQIEGKQNAYTLKQPGFTTAGVQKIQTEGFDTLDLQDIPDRGDKYIDQIAPYAFSPSYSVASTYPNDFMKPAIGRADISKVRTNWSVGCLKYLRFPDTLSLADNDVFREIYCFKEIYIPNWSPEKLSTVFGIMLNKANMLASMQGIESLRIPAGFPMFLQDICTGSVLTSNWWSNDLKNITLGNSYTNDEGETVTQNFKIANYYDSQKKLIGQAAVPKQKLNSVFGNYTLNSSGAHCYNWVPLANWGYFKIDEPEEGDAITPNVLSGYASYNRELDALDLPSNIKYIRYYAMKLKSQYTLETPADYVYALILRSDTVVQSITEKDNTDATGTNPEKNYGFQVLDCSNYIKIYVPDSLVDSYKADPGWKNGTHDNENNKVADKIFPISQLPNCYKGVTVEYEEVL